MSRGLFTSIIFHALCYLIKLDKNCMLLLCTVLSFNFIKDSKTLGYSFYFFEVLKNRKNIFTMLGAKLFIIMGWTLMKGPLYTLRDSLAQALHNTHLRYCKEHETVFLWWWIFTWCSCFPFCTLHQVNICTFFFFFCSYFRHCITLYFPFYAFII